MLQARKQNQNFIRMKIYRRKPELLGVGIIGKEFYKQELEHPSKFQQRLKELQDNPDKMQSHFPKKPLITPPNLKK
ncbi:hypothetical protein [Elizabethkingia anophelis]|uniref:hypothetical protein n=2 Tax=Elizabethkingia anophelis TaxID=1117645 RepID=UPI001C895D64|nr:hypothetical protein [Elizabethkingia anophelis]